MAVYPPIASSTFRWFRLPTGHAPATLPCDAVEPPTTRQIGDSPTFDRIVIGGVQEPPHNNQWLVGWRPIRLWSEFIWARRILPVIVRHYSDELRWSPDENVLPVSHQCLVIIGLPTGCSDHTPASNVPALYLRDKLKCVQPISDKIGRKWKIDFPTSFRPAAGLCGRGASSWVVTSVTLTFDLCPWPLAWTSLLSLSGVPDFFYRNKILSGGDLSHYQVPHCIRVFFYFVWFVFIHHNFQFYFELCTYCNILDIYLS